MVREIWEKTPLPKNIFQLGNVHGISLRWWVCVPGCLLILWNEYLVYFWTLEGLQNLWKNFLSKSEKWHPSFSSFSFHFKKSKETFLFSYIIFFIWKYQKTFRVFQGWNTDYFGGWESSTKSRDETREDMENLMVCVGHENYPN